jgi:ADP-heptose:LPS heptosyltransferase
MASRLSTRARILPAALLRRFTVRRRRPEHPSSILVAHHLLLGDTFMLTPLLAKLREQHPAAQIAMTVRTEAAPLYAGKPYGVEAIAWDPRDQVGLARLREAGGFDLAYVPGDNRYSWLAAAAGARWILAHEGDRPAYKSWPVDELRPLPAAPAAWGDLIAGLVDGTAPQPYSTADWADPLHAPFEAPAGRYALLHVGASTPLKQWRPEYWRALAERLEASGLEVAWSAGPGEEEAVREVDPAVDRNTRRRSYAGRLDLPQLWALVKGARLLVCPDTSVAHLGRIVGTPTVTLFGPGSAVLCGAGDFWRDAPYRAVTVEDWHCRDQRVLFKREIEWVRRCGRSIAQCPEPRCMHAIAVEDVAAAALALARS